MPFFARRIFPRGVNDPHGIALPFRQRWLRIEPNGAGIDQLQQGLPQLLFLVVKVLTQQQSAVIGIGDAVVEARLK